MNQKDFQNKYNFLKPFETVPPLKWSDVKDLDDDGFRSLIIERINFIIQKEKDTYANLGSVLYMIHETSDTMAKLDKDLNTSMGKMDKDVSEVKMTLVKFESTARTLIWVMATGAVMGLAALIKFLIH